MSAPWAAASASSVRLVWRPLRATSVMPFLWPSSSSSTIIGRNTSCSSKRNRHIGSCSSTLVSSTNNLAAEPGFFTFTGAGAGACTGARSGSATKLTAGACTGCTGSGARVRRSALAGAAGTGSRTASGACVGLAASKRALADVARVRGRAWPFAPALADVSRLSTASRAARWVGAGGNGMGEIGGVGDVTAKKPLRQLSGLFVGGVGRRAQAQRHSDIMQEAADSHAAPGISAFCARPLP